MKKSKTKSVHTPTPFESKKGGDSYLIFGADRTGRALANVFYDSPRSRENKAFIIRACNSHEELLDALKAARSALYNVPEVGHKYDNQHSHTHIQACLDIDAAIAKATGGI